MGLHADLVARRGSFEVDVALDVDDGETLALLGPNGAGKSTVVDALIGTLELAEGVDRDRRRTGRRAAARAAADRRLLPGRSSLPEALRARERGVPVASAEGPQGRRAPTSGRTARAARPGRGSERTTELDVGRGATARRARPSARTGAAIARARRAVLERRRLGPSGAAGAGPRGHTHVRRRDGADRARPARRADPRRPRCAARRRTDHADRHARRDPRRTLVALRGRPGRGEPVRRGAGAPRGRRGDAAHPRRRDHGLARGGRRIRHAERSPA